MHQVHGIKKFNDLITKSFRPDTPSNFQMKIIRPFLDSDPLTLSQEEFNNNNVNVSKGKGKSSQKKAKKRKIETSSDSEDYEEKDLVEDESDGSMKNIKPVLDSDLLTLSQEEFNTGKSFSEELILASNNPQYDKRLFIKLRVLYMKIASSGYFEDMLSTCCVNKLFNEQSVVMLWVS